MNRICMVETVKYCYYLASRLFPYGIGAQAHGSSLTPKVIWRFVHKKKSHLELIYAKKIKQNSFI